MITELPPKVGPLSINERDILLIRAVKTEAVPENQAHSLPLLILDLGLVTMLLAT